MTVELGTETFTGHGAVAAGEERATGLRQQAQRYPGFAEYEREDHPGHPRRGAGS